MTEFKKQIIGTDADPFNCEHSVIFIRLKMLGDEDGKEKFEKYLVDRLRKMLEDGDDLFKDQDILSLYYDVDLHRMSKTA